MLIRRANKYCAERTPLQQQELGRWIGARRFVYNAALEERDSAWRSTGNARQELVWGKCADKRGNEREGYIRRHLADVPPDPKRLSNWYSQKRELPERRDRVEWRDEGSARGSRWSSSMPVNAGNGGGRSPQGRGLHSRLERGFVRGGIAAGDRGSETPAFRRGAHVTL
jgi:hypothetical protein